MPYNYRVVRLPLDKDDVDDWVEIRQVYYDNTGHGKVYDYLDEETDLKIETIAKGFPDSQTIAAKSLDDLRWVLTKMLAATEKAILDL